MADDCSRNGSRLLPDQRPEKARYKNGKDSDQAEGKGKNRNDGEKMVQGIESCGRQDSQICAHAGAQLRKHIPAPIEFF